MKQEPTEERHESYGLFGVSCSVGGDGVLFGSHVLHNQQIRIRIRRAKVQRDLHQDWVHGDQHEIIEVAMSPTQWAEAITSMGMGDGVPCTINKVMGKRMAPPPHKSERKNIQDEFAADMKQAASLLDDRIAAVRALLEKKSVTKGDIREILGTLGRLKMELGANAAFVHKQFDEAMDRTVAEAKGEVEAFVQHTIMRAGLEALGARLAAPPLLEDRHDVAEERTEG